MYVIKSNRKTNSYTVRKINRVTQVVRVGRRGLQGETGPQGPQGPKGDQGDPATNLVQSVNGKQGVVVLNATDVGADASGSASQALQDAKDYTDTEVSTLDASLATVAKTGSYNDLSNKPTIPSIAGLATETYVDNAVAPKANTSDLGTAAFEDVEDLPVSTAQQAALDGRVKVGGGITSIRSTYDANEAPVAGEMLVVLSAKLFTDFSEYTTGSQPSDWVQRWVASTWTVETDALATNGVVLRHNAVSGTGRRALSWSRADSLNTGINSQEMLVKFKSANISSALRTLMRGSGTSANTTGVVGYVQSSGVKRIFEYLGGSTGGIVDAPGTISYNSNSWYLIRHKVVGTTHSWRLWLASTPEQSTWDVTIVSPTTNTGFCGLTTFNAGITDIDWVSLDLAGGTAEMGPI